MHDALSFVAVGPQRTASSWLDRALRHHNNLALPSNVKETFFFDVYYDYGLSWYLGHFKATKNKKVLGEVGSTYFESEVARQRILAHNPQAHIIITVRSPIARSYSSFRHEYAKGRVPGDFFQAIQSKPRIIESGRYAVLAPKWEEAFGRDQVLYLVQSDIESDPQGQIDLICKFLGLESMELPAVLRSSYGEGTIPRYPWLAAAASRTVFLIRRAGMHRVVEVGKRLGLKRVYKGGSVGSPSMSRLIYDYLLDRHEGDIAWLESRLGRCFAHWRDPATYGLQE